MVPEIVRMLWRPETLKIGGCGDDHPAEIGRQSLRDHVLRYRAAIANTAVESASYDIDHAVADGDFDLNVRIPLEEGGQDWADDEIRSLRGDAEPNPADRRVAEAVQNVHRPADLLEWRDNRRAKLFAGGCQRHTAARAIEQPDAETLLQAAECVT